jgi:hypothetical protein
MRGGEIHPALLERKVFVIPKKQQVHDALKHVAWEYAALLAEALPPVAYGTPLNHQMQESFLLHLRNLAEFFHEGTAEFRSNAAGALGPLPRGNDNVHAVDFCCKILWDEKPFDPNTKLRRALNKTLSHLTYSRDVGSGFSEIDIAYDGPSHTHGAVILVRRTWDAFVDSLRDEYRTELDDWLEKQAAGLKLSISSFDGQFDKWARQWGWRLNETPDGHI